MVLTCGSTGCWTEGSFELGKKIWGWRDGSIVKKYTAVSDNQSSIPSNHFGLWAAHNIL